MLEVLPFDGDLGLLCSRLQHLRLLGDGRFQFRNSLRLRLFAGGTGICPDSG